MLNFIPEDKNKEFGQDNVWTGSLIEWNLTGDTVYVQEVDKSVMKDQYCLKSPESSFSNSNTNISSKLGSMGSKGSRLSVGFWDWLGDALGDFIGWVSSLFGLPTVNYYDPYEGEWETRLRINLECLFGCNGVAPEGRGGAQGGTYVTFNYAIYDTYAPGYSGPSGPSDVSGTNTVWTTFSGGGGPLPILEQSLHDFISITDPQQLNYLETHADAEYLLIEYFNSVTYSQESIDFGSWALAYLTTYPNTNLGTFKNQFLGKSEGAEAGEYDADYWDNPNLSFIQQSLPTFSSFSAVYPLNTVGGLYDTPAKMYNSVGGQLSQFATQTNTCAIRISKALNYSGVIIPYIANQTYKGADDKYYFIRAIDVNKWMRKTFGTNDGDPTTPYNNKHVRYNAVQAGVNGINLPGLVAGKKGIYSLVSSNRQWATGHADILKSDGTCGIECHFGDAPIKFIDIWVLD